MSTIGIHCFFRMLLNLHWDHYYYLMAHLTPLYHRV